MKTLILIFLSFASFLLAQGELDIKPSNVDFKDEFHRIENVLLFNKGDEILSIDSITFKQNLFFISFDRPTSFPIQIVPEDSIKMDITLTNYFTVTSADTADTISFFTSHHEKDGHLRVRIRFFDDDEKYGTLSGQILNDSLSVENTKIYLFRDGQYLYDSLSTDVNGTFSTIIPEGFYSTAALKEGFYFTYYKNQYDIYNANQFYIDHDSTTSISWKIEKIIETNSVFTGNVLDYFSAAAVRKGIIVVRKGKHTPTKRSALANFLNLDFTHSTKIQSNGTFSFKNIIEPGFYYIQAFPDFYTPSYANDDNLPAILWQDADSVFIDNGIINKDIFVVRDSAYGAGIMNGQILINSMPATDGDFIVFAKNIDNNTYTNYSIADASGNFSVINLPLGNYKLSAYQFGNFNYESENFYTIDLSNLVLNDIELNLLVNSVNSESKIPNDSILFPNYPNPFNPTTNIQFFLPQEEKISLIILSILGEKVAEIYDGKVKAGLHNFTLDGRNLSSGVYFIRLETKKYIKIQKAILLK